jgi:Omp85 superfamily domain
MRNLRFTCFALTLCFTSRGAGQLCAPGKCARLVADIQVVNGVIRTVGWKNSKILDRELLTATKNSRIPADEELRKILVKDLDSALKLQPAFYWFALNSADQKDNAFQASLKTQFPCLFQSWKPGTWPLSTRPVSGSEPDSYTTCYTSAMMNVLKDPTHKHGFLALREALSDKFEDRLTGAGALQPLTSSDGSDATKGHMTFFIAALKSEQTWGSFIPNSPDVMLRNDLIQYLNAFDDGIWRKDRIRDLIQGFYARRGLGPSITVQEAKQPSAAMITIRPNPKVTSVLFIPHPTSDLDRRRALYNLLSSRAYDKVRDLQPDSDKDLGFDSLSLPPDAQPLFNSLAFGAEVQALSQLGFTASEVDGSDQTGSAIKVAKNDAKSPAAARPHTSAVAPGNAAVPAKAAAEPTGAGTKAIPQGPAPGKNCADPAAAGASTDDASGCPATVPPGDKKRFIGGGFTYQPGQGVNPIAAFEYDRLFGPGNITLEAGSANQLVNGTAAASFDYINFKRWNHRLTLDLKGGTDTVLNRLIGTRLLNERRNGGKAHAQLELLRDMLGASFSLYGDGGGQTVTLTEPNLQGPAATALTDTLFSGDLGGIWTLSRPDRARPFQIRAEPVARFGHAGAGGFAKAGVAVNYHQETLRAFVFEVNAQFAQASRNTPVYELPSFGGVTSLRGFRADDLLARRLWTVQPEVWTPVPFTGAPDNALAQFISQNMRLAAFYDFGGAYQTVAGPTGVKSGPGAGIRFQYHGAIIRGDWAYGLGTVATGVGHGRFYFSVSLPIV